MPRANPSVAPPLTCPRNTKKNHSGKGRSELLNSSTVHGGSRSAEQRGSAALGCPVGIELHLFSLPALQPVIRMWCLYSQPVLGIYLHKKQRKDQWVSPVAAVLKHCMPSLSVQALCSICFSLRCLLPGSFLLTLTLTRITTAPLANNLFFYYFVLTCV